LVKSGYNTTRAAGRLAERRVPAAVVEAAGTGESFRRVAARAGSVVVFGWQANSARECRMKYIVGQIRWAARCAGGPDPDRIEVVA